MMKFSKCFLAILTVSIVHGDVQDSLDLQTASDLADATLVSECLDNSINPDPMSHEDSDLIRIFPRKPRICPIPLEKISRDIIRKGRQKLQAAVKKWSDRAKSLRKSCQDDYYDKLLTCTGPEVLEAGSEAGSVEYVVNCDWGKYFSAE